MKILAYLILALATVGCVADVEDGKNDSFLDNGKADSGGIADGSPEALAVLRVANERPVSAMRDHGVPSLAAQNIVAVRVGDDALPATADDVTFTNLAQLDAVPFVGPQAFARLLAYATDLGYVSSTSTPLAPPTDLWNVAGCPRITQAQLLAKFAAGSGYYDFHRPFATASRHRDTCNPVTGCTPWQDGGAVLHMHDSNEWRVPVRSATRGTAAMTLYLTPTEVIINLTSDHNTTDLDFQCVGIDHLDSAPFKCSVRAHIDGIGAGYAGFSADYDDTLTVDGRICADGRFHFTSAVLGDQSDRPQNLNQISLYGQLF